jgi:hypothetical protein
MLLASLLVLLGTVARADDAPETHSPRVGVGWQMGNGLGALGADVIVLAAERLAIDVHLAYGRPDYGYTSMTSYAAAPALRAYLRREGFTPYAAVGVSVIRRTVDSLTWTRAKVFTNVGPEWRWPSGFRVFLGAGLGYGSDGIHEDHRLGINAEIGVRLMLL